MTSIAVLGTGLIGASVGIALRGAGHRVTGWDPDAGALAKAVEIGAVDDTAGSPDDAVAGADVVVLAGPVRAIVDAVATLRTDALVTDVAGVKRPVVEAARDLPRFVGGHPMAGRETSGPEGASGSMFRGATWVLCPDGADPADVELLSTLVASTGAIPTPMAATDHDVAVAAASHLPHLVAGALVRAVAADPGALGLAAGGFRDVTRIVTADPGWWVDVLLANGPAVVSSLRSLSASLDELAGLVEVGDDSGLRRRLQEARSIRSGMAAPVASVGVILQDRPGEIARVGHALASSGVDLRDLQLRHATHGGGGVLTLSVRAEELDGLRRALGEDGFDLVETR
jgi:prephenate dehydrogenase